MPSLLKYSKYLDILQVILIEKLDLLQVSLIAW